MNSIKVHPRIAEYINYTAREGYAGARTRQLEANMLELARYRDGVAGLALRTPYGRWAPWKQAVREWRAFC